MGGLSIDNMRCLFAHLKFLTWSSTPDKETEYDKAMLYVPAWTDEPQFTSVDVKTTHKWGDYEKKSEKQN